MSQTPAIDIHEAKKRIEAGAILVDVREENEYQERHIPGSILIPLSVFADRFEELPKDKPLVMQCRSGARSGKATDFLLVRGYDNAVNMTGGIMAWAEAGLETT
ncbi:MAG: rhodanese-like domain-containing protein [Deinococcales bacterium]